MTEYAAMAAQCLLPFQATHTKRLLRIAGSERLRPHAAVLPADSTTLGKLCSLTDERFHDLLEDGTIHASMGRNDMAVHAALDSLERILASGGSWGESSGPRSRCSGPLARVRLE